MIAISKVIADGNSLYAASVNEILTALNST